MKYSELDIDAQKVAMNDYQSGWLETHTDIFSTRELHEFCMDTNEDVNYNPNGTIIEEE